MATSSEPEGKPDMQMKLKNGKLEAYKVFQFVPENKISSFLTGLKFRITNIEEKVEKIAIEVKLIPKADLQSQLDMCTVMYIEPRCPKDCSAPSKRHKAGLDKNRGMSQYISETFVENKSWHVKSIGENSQVANWQLMNLDPEKTDIKDFHFSMVVSASTDFLARTTIKYSKKFSKGSTFKSTREESISFERNMKIEVPDEWKPNP